MPVLFVWLSVGFLILAAGIGAALLRAHMQKRPVALTAAIVHGSFALVGLTLLTVAVIQSGQLPREQGAQLGSAALGPWPKIALGLLLVAAAGGATLLWFHVQRGRIPIAVGVLHALAAAGGVALLVMVMLLRTRGAGPVPLDQAPPQARADTLSTK